jgi:transcriptional regulator with XRE-family HTH domain
VPTEDPEGLLRDIGRRIAELRIERGLTQQEFAGQLRIAVRYLARLEAGGQNMTIHRLVWLARALRVRVVDLLKPPRTREVSVGRPKRQSPTTAASVDVSQRAAEGPSGRRPASQRKRNMKRTQKRS